MVEKTLQQFKDDVDVESIANGLSASETAIYKAIRNVGAQFSFDVQTMLLDFKEDVDNKLANKQPYSKYQLPDEIKKFQNGDNLSVTDIGEIYYSVIDASKQIVTQVSLKELGDGVLRFKVAKDDGANKVPLTEAELANLVSYVKEILIDGQRFGINSIAADVITYRINADYESLYTEAYINEKIDEALVDFRNNLRYDGVFYKSALQAKIKSIEGVLGVTIEIDIDMTNGADVVNLVEKVELSAGYYNYNTGASSITLNRV